jgi:hypothetical protein
MQYRRTTPFPNTLIDHYLPTLSLAELKVLLVIIRQTNGWINKATGARKKRDRICYSQFMTKTGLCRRIISKTVHDLVVQGLILVTDYRGNILDTAARRKGKQLFYDPSPLNRVHFDTLTSAKSRSHPVQKGAYNKTNYTKETVTKREQAIFSVIEDVIATIQHHMGSPDAE